MNFLLPPVLVPFLLLLVRITEQEQARVRNAGGKRRALRYAVSDVATLTVGETPIGETALNAGGRAGPTSRAFGSQRPRPKRLPNAGIPGPTIHRPYVFACVV
ncbi:unnamed protein product [Pleuronectes platessa]|uniref:Secreted protein n=1 Tax=Pleuronectes platessa TaxID=8262 RepID=A0A9N7V4A6_PLEPL|nr:unnamed protein product [Pleuronectes platessa]